MMKKIFCLFILTLFVLINMSSCQKLENGNIFNGIQDNDNSISGDEPLLGFYNISSYTKFVSKTDLPEDFVHYDDIKALGEFKEVVFLCDAENGDFSHYMYSLVDKNAGEFTLYVDKKPFYESEHTKNVITEVDKSDMRSLDTEISGTYQQDNLRYVFISGKLISIEWKSGDWYYTISSIDDLKEDTSKANISKLFNLETAPDLIASVAKPEEIK